MENKIHGTIDSSLPNDERVGDGGDSCTMDGGGLPPAYSDGSYLGARNVSSSVTDGPQVIQDSKTRDAVIVYKQKACIWLANFLIVAYSLQEIYMQVERNITLPVPTWVLFVVAGAYSGSFDGIGVPSVNTFKDLLLSLMTKHNESMKK